jgi:tRNA A37 threonylcarbamoyladenosine biosynthesis protein TsaE
MKQMMIQQEKRVSSPSFKVMNEVLGKRLLVLHLKERENEFDISFEEREGLPQKERESPR